MSGDTWRGIASHDKCGAVPLWVSLLKPSIFYQQLQAL